MVTSTQPDQSPVAGQVLFYNNPEPLDPVRHANLAMKASERPYKFAAKQHYLPVQVGEFAVAGLSFALGSIPPASCAGTPSSAPATTRLSGLLSALTGRSTSGPKRPVSKAR